MRSRRQEHDQLTAELAQHRAERARTLEARGLPAAEAMRRAQIEFGSTEKYAEQAREAAGLAALEHALQDLRFGLRMLGKAPGFTLAAVLLLALAIGANTAVFSVVAPILLARPPFPNSDRIVELVNLDAQGGLRWGNPQWSGDFAEDRATLAAAGHAFAALAGWSNRAANLAAKAGSAHVDVMQVTPGFFSIWGIGAARGRTLLPTDSGGGGAVVLSDRLWRGVLGGGDLVGREVRLDGEAYTVVGIMPPGFAHGLFDPDVWTVLDLTPQQLAAHTRAAAATLTVAGRLRAGATLAQAQGEVRAVAAVQARRHREEGAGGGVTAEPIARAIAASNVDPATLGMLLGITGVLLMIGCASVAGLQFQRGWARAPEFATRLALGATRGRLLRQLLTESLLLAALASAAALGLGWLALEWMNATLLAGSAVAARLDFRVLGFTAAVSLVAALLAGLAPALQASRSRPFRNRRAQRVRSTLVAGEIALSLLGVAACFTLIQAVWQEFHIPLGFQPSGVASAKLDLAGAAYAQAGRRIVLENRLEAAVAVLPGIAAVALVSPPALRWDQPAVEVPGRALKLDTPVRVWAVSPRYFGVLGIPLQDGRGFGASDVAAGAPVALISRTAARRLFPGDASALGQRLRIVRDGEPAGWREVVGIVDDVKAWHAEPPGSAINVYEPLPQSPARSLGMLLKSAGPPTVQLAAVAAGVRAAVARLDASLPVYDVQAASEIVAQQYGGDRYFAELLAALVGLVLVSGGVGLYGIVAFAAVARRREVAIRMALGSPRARTTWMLAASGLRLAAIGGAVGVFLAWVDSLLLTRMFEGAVHAQSAGLIAATLAILLAVVAVATYAPARRATRVQPMLVLKEQ